MYSDEYIESLLCEAESLRPRIEELRSIIFCSDSKATVPELKEFCTLADRYSEVTKIIDEYKSYLKSKIKEQDALISQKEAELRIKESIIAAHENRLKK